MCVSQDESLNLSEPQRPNQQNENIKSDDFYMPFSVHVLGYDAPCLIMLRLKILDGIGPKEFVN